MKTGLILAIIGFIGYLIKKPLVRHYITKDFLKRKQKSLEDLRNHINNNDELIPDVNSVPGWVSIVGILSFLLIVAGIVLIVISYFNK